MTSKFDTYLIGKEIISLDVVNSTNDFLKQLVSEKTLKEGLVVISSFQTEGKGQMGNRWYASKDLNFIGSILLHPNFIPLSDFFHLNKIISLACVKALSEFISNHHLKGKLNIKWPNDIYLNEKKIGGILIENSIQGSSIYQSIIGIGINLEEPSFPDFIPNASSLAIEFPNTKWDNYFEKILYHSIEHYYHKAKIQNTLNQEYHSYLLFLDEPKEYRDQNGLFIGTIKGVDENGQLCILDENNSMRKYSFKEVSYCAS